MAGTHEDPRYFAHERLDAYELAVAAVRFVADRKHKLRGLPGKAGDQLERAVVGAQTAVCSAAAAEGAERRRLFRGALSEASEAGGAIDTALAYGALTRAQSTRPCDRPYCACARACTGSRIADAVSVDASRARAWPGSPRSWSWS
ncbi:MAG TPA: hypothetical protein VKN99_23095 [Polyangia bacterium]|nr:hypothetical protein [Polyangia bacterium]